MTQVRKAFSVFQIVLAGCFVPWVIVPGSPGATDEGLGLATLALCTSAAIGAATSRRVERNDIGQVAVLLAVGAAIAAMGFLGAALALRAMAVN